MNQDKIKEGFEAWFKTTSYYDGPGFTLHKNTQLVSWLAFAEWIMSQATEGFKYYQDQNKDYYFGSPNRCARDEKLWQAAKLSSMKELAGKDALIKKLQDVINECCNENPYEFSSYCSSLHYEYDKQIAEKDARIKELETFKAAMTDAAAIDLKRIAELTAELAKKEGL
jgi:hypothetical protein